jgi:hypothetical protein
MAGNNYVHFYYQNEHKTLTTNKHNGMMIQQFILVLYM